MDFVEVDPSGSLAAESMRRYYAEIDARFPDGFDPGDPPPLEVFVVAVQLEDPTRPVAGGGLQRLEPGVDEVKRMWVDPQVRGAGLGARLLTQLEQLALARGSELVRLDTRSELTEAIALYERSGYTAVPRYNDNRYAQLFFAKRLPAT